MIAAELNDAVKEKLIQLIEEFIVDLRVGIVKYDFNDTGDAGKSIKLHVNGSTFTVVGNDYIEVLERGTGRWAEPENWRYLAYILDKSGWAKRRGLEPYIYPIAYNIAHFGNNVKRGKRSGLPVSTYTAELKKKIEAEMPVFLKAKMEKVLRGISEKTARKYNNTKSK